jgi:hypothetical protein
MPQFDLIIFNLYIEMFFLFFIFLFLTLIIVLFFYCSGKWLQLDFRRPFFFLFYILVSFMSLRHIFFIYFEDDVTII